MRGGGTCSSGPVRLLGATAVLSAVDDGHISRLVTLAGGRREVVQPFDLLDAQLDMVGRD